MGIRELPRCVHGHILMDWAENRLNPPCGCGKYFHENKVKSITEADLQICRETVGYLMNKAKTFKYDTNNMKAFEERARAVQKLIDSR